MFPIRCYTCDAVIAQHWTAYSTGLRDNKSIDSLLRDAQQERMCCRRMFLSHVDLTQEQKKYPAVDATLDAFGTVLRRKVTLVRECSCD